MEGAKDAKFEGRALYQANFSLHFSQKVLESVILAGLFAAILIIGVALYCCCCRFQRRKKALAQAPDIECSGPKRFSYLELSKATNKFNIKLKLGEGGFGDVYQGKLANSNDELVAVKKFKSGSSQGEKEYASEVNVISMLRHKNLVQFKGWCHENRDLLLVYEFMPNRSLDFHLFGKDMPLLTWPTRYKIVVDLASALHYLQEGCDPFVLHRDIKSSNIMLDSNFNAKLGDFGLARLTNQDQVFKTTLPAGTLGYLAPEAISSGKVSKASDIYSFGVVALEIATGRRPSNKSKQDSRKLNLVEWVWDLYGVGSILEAVDTRLSGEIDQDQARRLMVVGLWCCYPDPGIRPSIKQVLALLNFEAEEPNLPPTIPTPTYMNSPQMNMYMLSSNASMDTESIRSSAATSRAYASSSTTITSSSSTTSKK